MSSPYEPKRLPRYSRAEELIKAINAGWAAIGMRNPSRNLDKIPADKPDKVEL